MNGVIWCLDELIRYMLITSLKFENFGFLDAYEHVRFSGNLFAFEVCRRCKV